MRKGVLGSGDERNEDLIGGIGDGLIAKHPKTTKAEERYPRAARACLTQARFNTGPVEERAVLEGGGQDGGRVHVLVEGAYFALKVRHRQAVLSLDLLQTTLNRIGGRLECRPKRATFRRLRKGSKTLDG